MMSNQPNLATSGLQTISELLHWMNERYYARMRQIDIHPPFPLHQLQVS